MTTPRDILIANGTGNFIQTFNNSTDAVKPGHIVTMVDQTQKNVAWPDAANEPPVGVVGCGPGHDIDTAYAVGDMMPVYMCGSGATVWVRLKASAGALSAGYLIDTTVDATGLATIGVEGLYENLGRITHFHADVASEQWVKVRLSV
jgi:hypothetical protein